MAPKSPPSNAVTDPAERDRLEAFADEIFELTNLSSRARAAARQDGGVEVLTETEQVTLDLLRKNGVMTVGEIQRAVGVLPAQMSRIIRSLEDKGGKAFIDCAINAADRRKIDVSLTKDGKRALEAYRGARLAMTIAVLGGLDPAEREQFMQILRRIRQNISKLISDNNLTS